MSGCRGLSHFTIVYYHYHHHHHHHHHHHQSFELLWRPLWYSTIWTTWSHTLSCTILNYFIFSVAVKLTKQIMHQTVTKSFLAQSYLSTTLLYAGLYTLVYKIEVSGTTELVNSLTPRSDQHLISPYNITPESHINVTGTKEMITL